MKILYILNRFFPAIGGAEKHTYLLSKYLAKNGHDVTVYTTTSTSKNDVTSLKLTPPFIFNPAKRINPPREEVIAGFNVVRYEMKLRFWSFNWVPDLFKDLKINVYNFDIIHAHGYHISSSVEGCYYSKKNGKPFILTAHDLIIPNDLPIEAKIFKKIYDNSFGKYLLKNATMLIALTEDHVAQYTKRCASPDKIRIVPNAIELDNYLYGSQNSTSAFNYGISDDTKILLFVGRIDRYKGIQDVIECLPLIAQVHPTIKFIVVGGDYGYRGVLEKLVENLELQNQVIFTGNILEEELIALYKRADIFVLPSKMEGFGIVLLEAMASGTLCIAYSIPSVRRVINDNVTGVLVKDRKDLVKKILYYLENINERRIIENNALKFVRKYDIKYLVSSIENAYEEALSCESA